ncbi:MAG TPA: GntR family transcriptional regulator [Clostridiales bacterium]|nr:GntR family transcriptional regulator [Clostridiales bacterium]
MGNLNITISNTSEKPLYEQIKEQIKSAILKQELENGELLPSIRNFSTDLSVSILTIRRVYDELEKEGFVSSRAGKGTFVLAGNKDLIEDTKRVLIEEKLIGLINLAKTLDMDIEELHRMLDIVYEEA